MIILIVLLCLYSFLELFKPTISNIPGNETLIEHENNHSVVNYSVSGTPSPNIAWYKFTNGTQYVIATCCGKTKKCSPVSENDIEVTMHSFVIKNTSYKDHDNVTFICQATNVKGKEEKKFTMFVKSKYTKPKKDVCNIIKHLIKNIVVNKHLFGLIGNWVCALVPLYITHQIACLFYTMHRLLIDSLETHQNKNMTHYQCTLVNMLTLTPQMKTRGWLFKA